MGREVKKNVEKHDVQLAADCIEVGYYGMLAGKNGERVFFLTKCDGKWVWASPGADRNYTAGCSSFSEAMQRALEFADNKVILFDDTVSLFAFMQNPFKHLDKNAH